MVQNLVPTTATRNIVDAMVGTTIKSGSGFDAAATHLVNLQPDQLAAAFGLLLNLATRSHRAGRLPTAFTEEDRRAGHNRYRQGIRDPLTILQAREYQRLRARAYRAAKGITSGSSSSARSSSGRAA